MTPPRRSPAFATIFALAPLVTFWAVEAWWSTQAALVASMVLVLVDVALSKWLDGRVPGMVWLTTALVLGLGGLSLLDDDPFWMLWSPVVGDAVFAGILLVSVARGRPLLVAAVREQRPDEPPDEVEARFLGRATAHLGVFLLGHGAATALSITASREVWLAVSGPGQYLTLGAWLALEWALAQHLPAAPPPSDG